MADKEKKMLGTAQMAKRLKIDPKFLRVVLRAQPGKREEFKRYEWEDTEASVKKVQKMVDDYKAEHDKPGPKASTKKEKKAKAGKKSKKPKKDESAEEEEQEEESSDEEVL